MKMTKVMTTLLSVLLISSAWGNTTLDTLLVKVKNEQAEQAAIAQKREEEFLAAKGKQAELLAKAKAELAQLEKTSSALTGVFDNNEKELAELEDKLNQATGTLGEMFGVVKQISGDLGAQFENSVISAQLKGRDKFITQLAARKELPTIDELRKLWYEIMGETNEAGKVTRFKSTVVQADGNSSEKTVTRIGAFNVVADGKYLNYLGETGQLVELSRQPEGKYLGMIDDLENTKSGVVAVGVDPSRGVLLSMLVTAPSLMERFHQGGLVGYVITVLLALGVVIVIERTIYLGREKKKMVAQLADKTPHDDNAIGRLQAVFQQHKNDDIGTLELKMEESIMKSVPPLEKGIGILKILTAIGPLMGLLGTVTGMITTFQTITMFGTGDPKLMAGGISTALVTTVQGLICAIPMLLLHNYTSSKARELVQLLEEQSAGLLSEKAGK